MPQAPADKRLGIPFIELQSVDSTNNYARGLLHPEIKENMTVRQLRRNPESFGPDSQPDDLHGTAIYAHEQLSGRGQRGRVWTTEKSANIILSLILNPVGLKTSEQFRLNACVAISLHEFFSKFAGDSTRIKWPNDLYWQDRKAGGVLIETGVSSRQSAVSNQQFAIGDAQWNWAIVGIGININQTLFPAEIKNPVSLKQITGKEYNSVELAKELCEILDKNYRKLIEEGFDDIYTSYINHLYKKNEKVKLKKDSQMFEGIIKGVTKSGQLIVQHAFEEEFEFGTLEWIL